jgi:glutaredoxin
MHLILYSKPGCHLCEGLQEKLEQVQGLEFELEVRDITTREDWFQAYQYEIPVLFIVREQRLRESGSNHFELKDSEYSSAPTENSHALVLIPRLSPRASVKQLERMLQRFLSESSENRAE